MKALQVFCGGPKRIFTGIKETKGKAMTKKILGVFLILTFFSFICTMNDSHAGGGGGCGDDEGCNNAMIGIAVGGIILITALVIYSYYSKSSSQKPKDQAFLQEDSPLPVVNFVSTNQTPKVENPLLSPNDIDQRVHEWGKFVIVRW